MAWNIQNPQGPIYMRETPLMDKLIHHKTPDIVNLHYKHMEASHFRYGDILQKPNINIQPMNPKYMGVFSGPYKTQGRGYSPIFPHSMAQ